MYIKQYMIKHLVNKNRLDSMLKKVVSGSLKNQISPKVDTILQEKNTLNRWYFFNMKIAKAKYTTIKLIPIGIEAPTLYSFEKVLTI